MGNKVINSPKDCMDNKKIEKFCREKNLQVERGKGDHVKIYHKDSMMVYCDRDMGLGLASKIFKWFKYVGLLIFIIILLASCGGII